MGTARWIVHSSATFEARHALATYKGEAEERHNHRWQIEVRVGTEELNSEGYALDFHDVHGILFDAVATLDGTELNDHANVSGSPSTSDEALPSSVTVSVTNAV